MSSDTQRRPDESMTLITSMLKRPLDPGYAAAAEAREAAGLSRSQGLHSRFMLVSVLVMGLVVGIGASALRGNDTTKGKARAELISQITARRASVDAQSARVASLQAEVSRLDALALGGDNAALQDQLNLASLIAGAVAVTGPGIVVSLDNAPATTNGGGAAGPQSDTATSNGKVIARDLQTVSNSLWQSGAEAISINGLRLTSLSAIRFAGEAILVDFRPLNPPYVLTAIGNPASMPRAFMNGSGGAYLATLKSSFGIQVATSPRTSVTIPAATSLLTREAVPRNTGPAQSPSSSTGGSP